MARPNNQGVHYFPLDVHLDDKFKFIEIKYGLEGFALIIKLLQKIYSYGYWYRWTEDEELIFADETRSDMKTVKEVVNEALKRDIFDKKLYEEYNILTSKGIQKRYKEIVRRRKDVEVIEEYTLIDDIVTSRSKQDDGTVTEKNKHGDGKNEQSKQKQKGKQKDKKYSAEFNQFWSVYPKKADKGAAFKKFKTKMKEYDFETILEGTKKYAKHMKNSGTENQFIKHASTFLNNNSFLDEYEELDNTPSYYLPNDRNPDLLQLQRDAKEQLQEGAW